MCDAQANLQAHLVVTAARTMFRLCWIQQLRTHIAIATRTQLSQLILVQQLCG